MLALSTALLALAGAGVNGASAVPCTTTQTSQLDCVSVPGHVTAVLVVFVVISIVVSIFFLVCEAKIISKAGYSGWFVLTAFVPVLNIVLFIVFAFAKWPVQAELEAAQRAAGRGFAPQPYGHAPPAGLIPAQSGAPAPAPQSASSGSPVAVDLQARVNGSSIFCSWCGKERAIDAESIHHCGSMERPPAYCMRCGTPLADGAQSCAACGTPSAQLSR